MSILVVLVASLWGGQDSAVVTTRLTDSVTVVHGTPRLVRSAEELVEEQEPAAALVRRGPVAAEPVVHGGSGNQAPVTLDGARIQTGCTDHMDPATSYVEGNDLDDVSVATTAAGLAEGGGTLGKVDVSLRRARLGPESLRWNTAVSGSSVDLGTRAAGNVAWSTPDFAILTSASARKTENYDGPGRIEVANSSMEKANAYVAATGRLSETDNLRGTFLWDRTGFVGYPALPMDVGLAQAWHGAVAWDHAGTDATALAQVYANSVHHEMDDTHRTDILMHMDMPGDGRVQGAVVGVGTNLGEHELRLRAEGWHGTQIATMTMYPSSGSTMYEETWPRTRTLGENASVWDTYRLSQAWTLEASARVEARQFSVLSQLGRKEVRILDQQASTSRDFVLPGGGASLAWKQSEGIAWTISVTDALRAPEMDELWGYYLYRVSDHYEHVGNSHLDPEESRQVELSWKISQGPLKLRAGVWALEINNTIGGAVDSDVYPQNMVAGELGVLRFQNLGTSHRVGAEGAANWTPSPRWQLSLVGHWLKDWNTPSTQASQLPGTGGRTSLAWIPSPALGVKSGLDWELPRKARSDLPGLGRGSGYAVPFLELNGSKTFRPVRLRWSLAVRNPFDQTYRSALDWGTAPRPGRNLEAGISLSG